MRNEIIVLDRLANLTLVGSHSGTNLAWLNFFHELHGCVGVSAIHDFSHLNLIFKVIQRSYILRNDRSCRGFSRPRRNYVLIYLIQTIFVFIENSRRILSCVGRGSKCSSFDRALWMNNDPILVHHILHLLSIGLLLLLQFGWPIIL